MRGVAGLLPNVRPLTLAAACALAGVTVAGALFVAHTIVAPDEPAAPRLAKLAPTPAKIVAHQPTSEHRKARRLKLEDQGAWEASVAPELAPDDDDAARLGALPPAPDGEAETGRASWYALPGPTASGEAMDETALTAAHPLLVVPFMLPPLLKISVKCSPGPTCSDPLNIMCSNRCAKPVRPFRSSREPTL
jgi:hypothetical protein